ncbi:MAG: efflux RND transporter periplasmic adaptor subunit [Holosporales bacterium]|nr:efflux RND transporter periplasmic adaptor subunit [Holosporales bacterium]
MNKTPDIILNGNVEIQDVNLSFRVPGRISKILVDEGSEVKKDEVIAILESDVFEVKLESSEAALSETKTNLRNAEKNYNRNKNLLKNKSIPEKLYDSSETEYEIAVAKVKSATAAYKSAMIDLKDTELRSPVDGIVLTKNVECSEMIGVGIPVFSVMPHTQTKVKTFANAEVLTQIKYGDEVYVCLDSGTKFKGHISFISSEAEFTPKNIETKELRTSLMYRIKVIVDDPATELKQGMPVTISYDKN